MEVSSGGKRRGLFFFFGVVLTLSASCVGVPVDETDASLRTCNEGWELCKTTNLCVLSACKDIDFSTIVYNRRRCPSGQVPCKAAGDACMFPCPSESELSNPTSPFQARCPNGKILCEKTMSCITQEECDNYEDESFTPMCSFGTSFCLEEGGCVEGGCHGKKTERILSCPSGMEFCTELERCVPEGSCDKQAPAYPPRLFDNMCLPWQTFCAERGTCVDRGSCKNQKDIQDESTGYYCLSSEEFCLSTSSCVPFGQCEDIPSSFISSQPIRCPENTLFCPSLRQCLTEKACKEYEASSISSESSQDMITCSSGKILCMATESCVFPKDCKEERELTSPLISCSPGEVFCAKTGSCKPANQCSGGGGQGKSITLCPPGKVFCAEAGSCIPANQCGRNDGGGKSVTLCPPGKMFCGVTGRCEDPSQCGGGNGESTTSSTPEVCNPSEVYCLSTGTCEKKGSCGGRPVGKMTTMCPRGYIYCLQEGECVRDSQGCGKRRRKLISCPPGSVFSIQKGECLADLSDGTELQDWLPDLKCPNVSLSERETFSHSTCLSNHHCPYGYSCCPDPETLHLQCMNPDGDVAQHSLSMTCLVIGQECHDTGLECQDPGDCRPGSVCCNGSCRSLRGVETCPLDTLYCPLSKTCIPVGTVCENVCNPTELLCLSSNECGMPEDCEFETSSGAAWTVPELIMLPQNEKATGRVIDEGIPFREVFSAARGTPDLSVKFDVMNVTTDFGTWYTKNKKKGEWQVVDDTSTIRAKGFLRYEPRETYDFGYEFLILKEQETGIERRVVQLLAPEKPEFKVETLQSELETKEEEFLMVSLTDIIGVTINDTEYWKTWWHDVDLPMDAAEEGLLDYSNEEAVVPWVKMLTQPGPQTRGRSGDRDSPDNMVGPREERGVRIALENPVTIDNAVAILAYSLNGGKKWEIMNSLKSADIPIRSESDARSVQIRFIPSLDASGEVAFVVSPYSNADDGEDNVKKKKKKKKKRRKNKNMGSVEMEEDEEKQKIVLKILSVNDAPNPKQSADLTKLPTLTRDNPNMGVPVETYAGIFYEDADDGRIGLCLLHAAGGTLGKWQYSVDGGSSFIDIDNLENDPIPKDLGIPPSHQGLVDIQKMKEKQQCDAKSALRNSDMMGALVSNCPSISSSKVENAEDAVPLDSAAPPDSQGVDSDPTELPDFEVFDASALSDQDRKNGGGFIFPDQFEKMVGKREAIGYAFKDETLSRSSPGRLRGKRNAGQAQFSGYGTGNLNVSTVYPSVDALCLPPWVLLRFEPAIDEAWDREAALSQTKLVFTAWDMTESSLNGRGEVMRRNISLQYCLETRSCHNGSVSWSPAVMSAEWSDCSGSKVTSGSPKVYDACGICGGDGTSCLDCADVLNGTAQIECLECVGGTTLKQANRDCAGKCGSENILNSRQVCVPASNPNVPSCDGSEDSDAILNECGICVLGNTGLDKDSGLDKCGVCGDRNDCLGCDGVKDSDHEVDLCNVCRSKWDPDFNACNAIGNVVPTTCDLAVAAVENDDIDDDEDRYSTLKADVSGIKKRDFDVEFCVLESDTGEVINATTVSFSKGTLRARFLLLPVGNCKLLCTFNLKNNKKKIKMSSETITANEEVEVIDSREMAVELSQDSKEVDNTQDTEVKLSLTKGKITPRMTCLLIVEKETRKGKKKIVMEVGTRVTGDREVTCAIPSSVPPGLAKVCLAPTPGTAEMVKSNRLDIPTAQLEIKSSPPRLVTAELDLTGENLRVLFDKNIKTAAECSDIFNWPWVDENKKSPPPICKIRASVISVQLRRGVNVVNGTDLVLSSNNGIRGEYSDPSSFPKIQGSIVVMQREAMNEIKFQFNGDTEACNGSDVKAFVSNIKGARPEDVTGIWNVSWSHGMADWSQSETLAMWDIVRKIKDNMVIKNTSRGEIMSFPGSMLVPNREFVYTVQLESEGLTSEAKSISVMTVPPGQALKVTIRGPSEPLADRKNRYTAVEVLCTEEDPVRNLDLKYMWNIEPEGAEWKSRESRRVTIPKGILRGGQTYKLSVKVYDVGNNLNGEGSLELNTVAQGVKAITTSDHIKVGSSSPMKLDASRSRDKDNNFGEMRYRWTCLMEDGSGCYVTGKDKTIERLETAIVEELLTKPKLKLPPKTLPPGKYIFTAEVSKDGASDTKDVRVEVAPTELPVIATQSSGVVVDAEKRVVIKGSITGQEKLKAWWRCVDMPGFSYVDISPLDCGQKTEFESKSFSREFDLVIPKPGESDSFEGLEEDASYLMELIAENSFGDSGFSQVEIRTNKKPVPGTFEVTPLQGEALVTNFTFSCSDWSDEDAPLTTFFGYRRKKNQDEEEEPPPAWVYSTTEESPTAVIVLTSDTPTAGMIPVVKVCDAYEACTMDEFDQIIVKLPASIPPEVLANLANNFEKGLQDNAAVKEALIGLKTQMATLRAMGANDQMSIMSVIAQEAISEKTFDLMNMLNSGQETSGTSNFLSGVVDLLEEMKMSEDTITDLLLVKRKLNAKLSGAPEMDYNDKAFSRLTNLPTTSDDDPVYFPKTDEDQNAVREGRPGTSALRADNRGTRRIKRQAPSDGTSPNVTFQSMDPKTVLTNLRLTEAAIVNAKDEGDLAARKKELLDDVKGYLPALCHSMSPQDDPKNVLSTFVSLRVLRSYLEFKLTKKFPIAESGENKDDFIEKDSFLRWGSVLKNFTEWECGRRGGEGEDLPCNGLCLATVLFKEDFLSSAARLNSIGELRGPVAQSVLLNYVNGVEIPVYSTTDDIIYLMYLYNYDVPEGKMLKCYGWDDNEWSDELCTTSKIIKDAKDIRRQRCYCRKPGYVAVFLVDKPPSTNQSPNAVDETTTSEISTTEETTTDPTTTVKIPAVNDNIRSVKFKINGSYEEVVGDEKEEFEKHITAEIAVKLSVTPRSIRNLTVSPGSILVEFDLVQDHTRLSGNSPDELYEKLAELVGSGDLVLKGLNAEALTVPPQSLDGSGSVTVKETQTILPIIIGAIVGGVVLIVIVLICIAVFLKNKKRMDKIQPLHQTGTQQPTYSSVHFEQSLDGTKASLAKHRNNASPATRSLSSGGTFSDEGIFIERRSTGSSRAGSGGTSSVDSGTGQEVPSAFRYKSPTREQLERSGPIPEEIAQRIKQEEEALPGTPGGLD